ncbi:MAG: polyphosphate kinase 1 [Oligosphaeraceae bacterium]|nr:polyphosphate kinase 1 [Oligosphaeraceae bacterium]
MTMKKKKTAPTVTANEFLNRELSWLEFNQRVLLEACNPEVPLLERLKFLSITASNLDEFCMVRVGGLKLLVAAKIRRTDPSGMTPRQQLVAVTRRMRKMVADQYELLESLSKELSEHGFVLLEGVDALTDEQRKWLEREFMDNIFPLISPVGVGDDRPFHPTGLLLHCAVLLNPVASDEAPRLAFIPLGPKLPRFIRIPDAAGRAVFLPIEQVVAWQIAAVMEGQSVRECVPFRVTRNADIELREDLSSDLLVGMQELLDDRLETECIRLEVHRCASRALMNAMTRQLDLDQAEVYYVDGPVELRSLMAIVQTDGFECLRPEQWEPVPSPDVDIKECIFTQIARGDILLVHPYESFDPVVKFISDAADDPQVLAIKQVLYRTASQSAIVEALIRAAQVGKYVTVLIELKARFDEARNISQARRLELAGVHVVYGVRSLKTHAKICLVVRRERQGIVRYVHFGTGNYNEKTAALYSDVGFFTCRNDFGADASDVFNAITGYSQPQSLRRLEMAPFSIRSTILKLITNETERARNNEKAEITMKMNSLSDDGIIAALYDASRAGVKIKLNVRGICCLKPGVPGMSENITVVSIVDYYLEHARIFRFRNGGLDDLYISSADMMTRNLDKRIELMIPVLAPGARKKLLATLDVYFADRVKARNLYPNGDYRLATPRGKEKPVRAQEELYRRAKAAARLQEQTKPTMLEPYHRKRNPQTDTTP